MATKHAAKTIIPKISLQLICDFPNFVVPPGIADPHTPRWGACSSPDHPAPSKPGGRRAKPVGRLARSGLARLLHSAK